MENCRKELLTAHGEVTMEEVEAGRKKKVKYALFGMAIPHIRRLHYSNRVVLLESERRVDRLIRYVKPKGLVRLERTYRKNRDVGKL
jgi:hypothetical protein